MSPGPAEGGAARGAAHPFAPRVRTRYLHQLVAFGPVLARWRRALHALLRPEGGRQASAAAARLRALRVATCFDRVPFWQDRFRALGWGRHHLTEAELVARWDLIPAVTRADLQGGLNPMTVHPLSARAREDLYEGVTSGSTGQPVHYRMDGAAYHSFFPVVDLVLAWLDLPRARAARGFVLLDVLGHSPEYGAWLPMFHGLRFEKLTVGRGDWRGRLRGLRPQIITGDPDSLAALLETDVRPDVVLSSAFALPPPLHAALVRHLGCPVVEYYSAAEVGPIALRCPSGRGWHVLTPYVHVDAVPEVAVPEAAVPEVEVAEDACGASPEGPGRQLLLTDLRNETMPLLRYAVGDLGAVDLHVTDCPCGLSTPRILTLDGRSNVRFRRADGGVWNPAQLAPSLGRLNLLDFEVHETGPGLIRLRYRAEHGLSARDEAALQARLRAVAGDHSRLECEHARDPWRSPGVKPVPFRPASEVNL